MVYVAMILPMLIFAMAFTIDLSRIYVCKAEAQKAADAAALAGAYQYANLTGSFADAKAREYASSAKNGGYTDGVNNTTVTTVYQPLDEFDVKQNNWFQVRISRLEPTFFAGIMGAQFRNVLVTAKSTALFETQVPLDTTGISGGTYGMAPGATNLALFGPDGWYNNGDKYSVRKLKNGVTNNPDYIGLDSNKSAKGYDFLITIPESFKNANSMAYVQLFDPDCYNVGNNTNPDGTTRIDEMRTSAGGLGLTDPAKGNKSTATTTQYRLWRDKGTPGNPLDDEPLMATATSYGSDPATDMKWNDLFSGNPKGLAQGEGLRLNVVTTDGSSENGFGIRVNNQPATSTVAFDSNNGTRVSADGKLPINFNVSGSVTMALGNVPRSAAGTQLSITKFDTDVQSKDVKYICDPAPAGMPAGGYPGVLASDGAELTDVIPLPADYQGGQWRAVYQAGSQDTSVWRMSYTGAGTGSPGRIKIIR
ncbi:MAG TPA: pilus assembly protein TadG-related protein [Abditibacterium sp.]